MGEVETAHVAVVVVDDADAEVVGVAADAQTEEDDLDGRDDELEEQQPGEKISYRVMTMVVGGADGGAENGDNDDEELGEDGIDNNNNGNDDRDNDDSDELS